MAMSQQRSESDAVLLKMNDCYFYFYSTCKKGDLCPFRHCEAALGTEVTCPDWREGNCFQGGCPLRHMESQKNRFEIPCYWENQPSGCRKPHCVFRHFKRGPMSNNPTTPEAGIIPGMMNTTKMWNNKPFMGQENVGKTIGGRTSALTMVFDPSAQKPQVNQSAPKLNFGGGNNANTFSPPTRPPLLPTPTVEPLVVNFDEESDSENCNIIVPGSLMNGPNSSGLRLPNIRSQQQQLHMPNNGQQLRQQFQPNRKRKDSEDIGIKTLDEIRREKRMRCDVTEGQENSNTVAEVNVAVSSVGDIDKSNSVATTATGAVVDVTKKIDLRQRLIQRKTSSPLTVTKTISTVTNASTIPPLMSTEKDDLNFKVKTLEEIRREKAGNSQDKGDLSSDRNNLNADGNCSSTAETATNSTEGDSSAKRLLNRSAGIKRKVELYVAPPLQKVVQDKEKQITTTAPLATPNQTKEDTVRVKTLAEIREERKKRFELENRKNLASAENSSSSKKVEVKRTISNKRIRLRHNVEPVAGDLSSGNEESQERTTENVARIEVLKESESDSNSNPVMESPSIKTKSSSVEIESEPKSAEVAEDEDDLDFLLDGEDELPSNVVSSDVKEDELLLELDDIINS